MERSLHSLILMEKSSGNETTYKSLHFTLEYNTFCSKKFEFLQNNDSIHLLKEPTCINHGPNIEETHISSIIEYMVMDEEKNGWNIIVSNDRKSSTPVLPSRVKDMMKIFRERIDSNLFILCHDFLILEIESSLDFDVR